MAISQGIGSATDGAKRRPLTGRHARLAPVAAAALLWAGCGESLGQQREERVLYAELVTAFEVDNEATAKLVFYARHCVAIPVDKRYGQPCNELAGYVVPNEPSSHLVLREVLGGPCAAALDELEHRRLDPQDVKVKLIEATLYPLRRALRTVDELTSRLGALKQQQAAALAACRP